MSVIDSKKILSAIADIRSSSGILIQALVSNIVIKPHEEKYNIAFSIDISNIKREEAELIKSTLTNKLKEISAIEKITIILTSEIKERSSSLKKEKLYIDNVKKIILISAGKGGVGKSTITSLMAEKLAATGYKIGIVDADIYGPSIPQIFQLKGIPEIINKKIIPFNSRGIQIISIGSLIKENNPVAWRGPMASKAIYQLLSLTDWHNLDYLFIDTPPGTGDIHLSILENYNIDGAAIITTPQLLSTIDVEKIINLYIKFEIPILSIIENMTYFVSNNGENIKIFPGEGGKKLAQKYGIRCIEQLPIIPSLAINCDHGTSLLHAANHLKMEWI